MQAGDPIQERMASVRRARRMRRTLLAALAAAAGAYALLGLAAGLAHVEGSSMEPSYREGDLVLFNRLAGSYEQGDVVMVEGGFRSYLVKRVVAVPGQTVSLDGAGRVEVDGEPMCEPYAVGGTFAREGASYPVVLGEGQYFLMGDNRMDSRDSRDYGPVEQERLAGAVVAVFRVEQ